MQFTLKTKLAAALIGCGVVALCPPSAMANILEELQAQPDHLTNVVRIRFNTRIQYLRHAQIGKSKVLQVYFQITQGTDLQIKSIESLKSDAFGLVPGITAVLLPQADEQTKTLELRFSAIKKGIKATVRPGPDNLSLDVIFGESGKAQSSLDTQRYAITLLSSTSRADIDGKVVPREFQDFDVFTLQQTRDGRTVYELDLGYFTTAAAAQRIRARLLAAFPQAGVVDLARRKQEALVQAAVQAKPQPSPELAQIAATQAALPQVEEQAAALMPKAQEALTAGNYEAAINDFNQILLLPPNKYSQDAQELVGLARQRNGELGKARAEYELYLKLFPQGPGADRVRQHVAELGTLAAPTPAAQARPGAAQPTIKTVSGGISQYYYGGQSQTQTAFNTQAAPGTSSITSTDQSSLRTNINLLGRYRDADADQKIGFQDDNIRSFIDTLPSRNRLNALYYDYKGLQNGFNTTLGRQSGSRLSGAPNRFDGVQLGYSFLPKTRATLVAGMPVEFPAQASKRKFWGLNLDAQNFTANLSGKAFFFDQYVDGIQDRRGVGGDINFFRAGMNISAFVDYDISYNLLNIGTLQGNWQTLGGSSFNFFLDRRRAPYLTTTNALYNQAVTSMSPPPATIKQLLQSSSESQIRAWAESASAIADQAMAGFLTPLNKTWQVGSDFSVSNTGPLPAVTLADGTQLPATPATGNIYTYSLRAIGSNLLTHQDTNVFTLSMNKGNTYHGELLAYNNVTNWNHWIFEPSMQYYQQRTDPSTHLTRWTPTLRLTYKIRDYLSLESEYTFEHSLETSPGTRVTTDRHSFYLGYRWDL